MRLAELEKNWNELGKTDPYWAILTDRSKKGNKWEKNEFYDSGIETFDRYWGIVTSLGLRPEPNYAMDFGCGAGRITQAMCRYFDRVVGVDIADSMVELAETNNRFSGTCRYLVTKKANLEICDDDTFDFIISLLTLQHIRPEYTRNYLCEFIRILKPGGLIIFDLPEEVKGISHRIHGFSIKYLNTFLNKVFDKPIMEMYGVDRGTIEKIVRSHGGNIMYIEKHDISDWTSYSYFVTKESR